MRIHFMFEPDSAARIGEQCLLAERQGFDAAWLPNILSARDPFLAFATAARDTRSLRLGPVAVSPFEMHPAKMANALLTLHELSRGRAQIVVGGGGGALIALGLKDSRQSVHPRMAEGVRECVEILRAAATGRAVSYAGKVFRVSDYLPDWAGHAAPLIYVAANKPRMMAVATALGDGVMLSDISPTYIDGTLDMIRTGLAAAGRPPAGFRVSNVIAWHVKADREAALLEARRKLWVRGLWERARLTPYIDAADCDRVARSLPDLARAYALGIDPSPAVPRPIMDALADGLTLVGDHDDVPKLLARLLAFRRAGVTETALRLYGDPAASIHLVAERIVPGLA